MTNNTNAEIVNMYSLSETKPKLREDLISRDLYLNFIDEQLKEYKVLCVDGVEGVGITTMLALFAKKHKDNCASYFNNGWSRHLLSPQTIVKSLRRQLDFFTKKEVVSDVDDTSFMNCVYKLNRAKNQLIFFVFDGFENIPAVYVDGIKEILSPLFNISNTRFLFSGDKEKVMKILPDSISVKQSNDLLRFQQNDIEGYLKKYFDPKIEQDDIDIIFKLSERGLARQFTALTEKLKNDGLGKIRFYYENMEKDFFSEDYQWIEQQKDKQLSLMIALLTFGEIPLNRQVVMQTLNISSEKMTELIEKCEKYVEENNNGVIALRSDDYRKYLYAKLIHLKTEIEILQIDLLEKSEDIGVQFAFLPALYKHVKKNKQLVDYLTSANVQHYIEDKKSQAALNEQCEYGYNACSNFQTQAAAFFRFAINRSVSHEIEKKELRDAEIEALIAIGDDEKAFALTQNVFLMEERLKSLLIVAQASQHLSDAMREEIDNQISSLVDSIDFEHIPEKSLELAKLMLPIKMEKALEIIDKVAKVTKDRQTIDRLYTAISISFNNEGKSEDIMGRKADIVNTKIEDDGLRQMAKVMKSIMRESTAIQVITKMQELPTVNSQLIFLQYWIPNHRTQADVGDVVEYAIKLSINTSQTMMPKVSLLKSFCKPLPDMSEHQVRKVVSLLDAMLATIKNPTVEYVKLVIQVASAFVKFDKREAKDRLQNLYLEILDFKDYALQAHCKALILSKYNNLGEVSDVEKWIASKNDLENEILGDVSRVLDNSAYHLKVVEGPVTVLVCNAPNLVTTIIEKMNTAERKSRAYLLATQEYVWQTEIKKIDWQYLTSLYKKVTYDTIELNKPLYDLVNKIVEINDKDPKLLENVKNNYEEFFYKVEQAESKCFFFATLYVWLVQNYNDVNFKRKLRKDLDDAWNIISIPSLKVDAGYQIVKILSAISMKSEAREYVNKVESVRKNQLLSSISYIVAYEQSFELYAHSLGILIRSGLCTNEDIDEFKKLMDYAGSESEAIILWSRVALEYYAVNDIDNFNAIMNKYVSHTIKEVFSKFAQKRILFNIAPALYLSSKAMFYERLKEYDNRFANDCIEHVARYIQTKYPYPKYSHSDDIQAQKLEKKDYDYLLDLMWHTKDDGFVFSMTEILTKSIKSNLGKLLSRESINALLSELEKIVNERLPMVGGIQHDGYKIACLIMIEEVKGSLDVRKRKTDIDSIGNKADQAFLYAHMACHLKRTDDKSEFIDQAVLKTEGIDYTFDKYNRFALCLQNSFVSIKSKSHDIAMKVMNSLKLDKNSSYSDYKRMLDLVRDHDVQLADSMLEQVDDDPARNQYKKRLKQEMESAKKIEAAQNDFEKVSKLTDDENRKLFEKQLDALIHKKSIIRDFDSTQYILKTIYEKPITDTQDTILYFIENLYQRNRSNKKYNILLREIHLSIVDNLKIVLSIASGTKEKMERVANIMNEGIDKNDNFIPVGQGDKGVQQLLNWYKEHPVDILRIIDPYFKAEDLFIIKSMMDENNQLNCSILTNNMETDPINDVFQRGWNMYSAELQGRIEVKSCCYEHNRQKAPFHDRWYLLFDPNTSEHFGKRMASPSTFGSRITEISPMDDAAIQSANMIFERFFQNMVPNCEGQKLKYDETKLR